MIAVTVATAEPSSALAESIARSITDITTSVLHKKADVVVISVDFFSPGLWFVGGKSTIGSARSGFFLEIRISDGTNTKDEKALYIAEAFAEMDRLLGGVHAESYVHVHDAKSDAYGYGGVTQEERHLHRRLGSESREPIRS